MSSRRVELLLLRHGQSVWNASRRWQGAFDSPLTGFGREQAAQAALAVAALGRRFDQPWSSSLQRASATATIIGAGLGWTSVRTDDRLIEADAGEWQGLTADEIEERWPGWRDSGRRPDSFETFDAVAERGSAALRDIANTTTDTALVVAHSGLIRTIIRSSGGTDVRIPNLGGVWVALEHGEITIGNLFDPTPAGETDPATLGETPARPSGA